MVGSVLDAEDIVQDSLISAFVNWPVEGVRNPKGWLFRIVHNRAIDHLRRTKRQAMEPLGEQPIEDVSASPFEQKEMARLALSVYLQLTPLQRSAFILKDVMGYSVADVSELLDVSIGSVKSVVHRARLRLKKIAPEEATLNIPSLAPADIVLLKDYVDRFTRRDFDGIRAQLIEDVRLDLVNRVRKQGSGNVGTYFGNYGEVDQLATEPVQFEGLPAMLVTDLDGSYVVVISCHKGCVATIRDFRFARYIMDSATILPVR
jgi:RNA polymerase sigma-70 factor (ECF subfamily)